MNRILLVEDHARLAALIRQALDKAGISVDVFEGIESAWSASRHMAYGAMVVDRGLPDGDGLALVQRCRAAGVHTPCLILTARDALHDRVEGLDGGADDYLTKPFAMDELVARVRALLRRPAEQHALTPACGDIQLQPDEGVMSCGDQRITLPPAEMQLMLDSCAVAARWFVATFWSLPPGDSPTPSRPTRWTSPCIVCAASCRPLVPGSESSTSGHSAMHFVRLRWLNSFSRQLMVASAGGVLFLCWYCSSPGSSRSCSFKETCFRRLASPNTPRPSESSCNSTLPATRSPWSFLRCRGSTRVLARKSPFAC